MLAILTGFLVGAAHVWTGPDHLGAIAPLAADRPGRAWLPGARWGLGHSSGVLIVGLLILLFREALPLEQLSGWSERIVGAMLIGIGLWAILKAARIRIHTHEHEHDGERHFHIHAHRTRGDDDLPSTHRHPHLAVGIGMLHGLAGSSHVFAILPMLALPTASASVLYLITFSLGTIGSMAAFSALVGITAKRFAGASEGLYTGFMISCGAVSVAIGTFWLSVSGH